nr:immunoglobulin light chain junction region [Macaca mulatta]
CLQYRSSPSTYSF